MSELWLLVLCMGLVTYVPRVLPMIFMQNMSLPPFIARFLQFIPFAALGALIFPGVFGSTGSLPSAVAGTAFAFALAWFRVNIMIVVLGGITGVFLWEVLSR